MGLTTQQKQQKQQNLLAYDHPGSKSLPTKATRRERKPTKRYAPEAKKQAATRVPRVASHHGLESSQESDDDSGEDYDDEYSHNETAAAPIKQATRIDAEPARSMETVVDQWATLRNENKRLQAKIAELKQENDGLNAELAELHQKKTDFDELRKLKADLRKECDGLKAERDGQAAELRKSIGKRDRQEIELLNLQTELSKRARVAEACAKLLSQNRESSVAEVRVLPTRA